jgi:phosphoribosylformylglycinamidine cyclo-ligase
MDEGSSYSLAGVDIDAADAAKRDMKSLLKAPKSLVLNEVGAFASLVDGSFPALEHPVLVLKVEEPGSKQLLAFQQGSHRTIAYDLVNHLINDVVVMGAAPVALLDTIICGNLDPAVVVELVRHMAAACREQGCHLVGGETSEQPGVLTAGNYALTAAALGVVDKDRIIDGTKIVPGDQILAFASSGLHTNGYSLVRHLLDADARLADQMVGGRTFMETILEPHRCYYPALKPLFASAPPHGLAHITGGGIRDNLQRILPAGARAVIDLSSLRVPRIFSIIRQAGSIAEDEMLRTFNLGVGLLAVLPRAEADQLLASPPAQYVVYPVGHIEAGAAAVEFRGSIRW